MIKNHHVPTLVVSFGVILLATWSSGCTNSSLGTPDDAALPSDANASMDPRRQAGMDASVSTGDAASDDAAPDCGLETCNQRDDDCDGNVDEAIDCPETPIRCAPLALPDRADLTRVVAHPGNAVAATEALLEAIADESTDAILLGDGTYRVSQAIDIDRPLLLMSESRQADRVILDAGDGFGDSLIKIQSPNVSIAHVTLMHASHHLIHVTPGPEPLTGTQIYDVRFVDGSQQLLKINSVQHSGTLYHADQGSIECSYFAITDAFRPRVATAGELQCYTGGIDLHMGRNWTIRNNRFEGIHCASIEENRLAEHAIHLWSGTADAIIENNFIVNCARGIGLGLSACGQLNGCRDGVQHRGGVVRNNVVFANLPWFDTGIGLEQASDVAIHHNTIVVDQSVFSRSLLGGIDLRFPETTNVDVRNNYTWRISNRSAGSIDASYNLEQDPIDWRYFAVEDLQQSTSDYSLPDFRLTELAVDAIDQGAPLPDAGQDLDGEPHTSGAPDIGADER